MGFGRGRRRDRIGVAAERMMPESCRRSHSLCSQHAAFVRLLARLRARALPASSRGAGISAYASRWSALLSFAAARAFAASLLALPLSPSFRKEKTKNMRTRTSTSAIRAVRSPRVQARAWSPYASLRPTRRASVTAFTSKGRRSIRRRAISITSGGRVEALSVGIAVGHAAACSPDWDCSRAW